MQYIFFDPRSGDHKIQSDRFHRRMTLTGFCPLVASGRFDLKRLSLSLLGGIFALTACCLILKISSLYLQQNYKLVTFLNDRISKSGLHVLIVVARHVCNDSQ